MIRLLASPLLPWLLGGLLASHSAVGLYVWHWRDGVHEARVEAAQAAEARAQARLIGLAEAQSRAAAERDALRQELDDAAANDPDADRVCLGADSVRRLDLP